MDNNINLDTDVLENISQFLITFNKALEPIAELSSTIVKVVEPFLQLVEALFKQVQDICSQMLANYAITKVNVGFISVGINDYCDISTAPPVVERKTSKDRLYNVKAKTLNIWGSKPIKWIRQFTYDCSTQIISSALFSLLIYLLRVWGVL